MHADKTYDSRGLGGARRAMPGDEFPQGTALSRPAVIARPDPEVGRHADTASFHSGEHAAHPESGRCLYRGKQLGGPAARRRTLRFEPYDVASPMHGRCALGLDTPDGRPKGLGPTSATGGE